MKKALMLGAMMAVVATAAQAKKIASSYSFYGFCDGLGDLTGTTVVTGLHVYENCGSGYTDTYVGGVKGAKDTYPLLNSEYSAPIALLYYTDFKALTWTLYADSTEYGIPFELLNEGTLATGYDAKIGGGKESTVHAAMMKAGLIKK